MATDKKQVEIPGRLHSVATEGVVTGANEILDDNKGKNQQDINASVDDSLQENRTNIANEITRATNAENAIKGGSSKSIQNLDSRLSTVEAHDTISMDGGSVVVGTAEDFTNRTTAGDAKIPTVGAILNGADEEPTAGSENLVKSGGVAREILLTNQKINDVEVVSSSPSGGVVPYAFEAGKTYKITNRKSSASVTISHRNTPDGQSSDVLTITGGQTVNYTVTSDGNYLRFGGGIDIVIKSPDRIANDLVEKTSVSKQQDYFGDGVSKNTFTVGDVSLSFATDVICQPLSRSSEISLEGKKGDTFVYNINGAYGFGLRIKGPNSIIKYFVIPSGQTNISGSYVIEEDATKIEAVYGDIVINAAYYKNTHNDSKISDLNTNVEDLDDRVETLENRSAENKITIKYFYNSNPNYTQSGSLLEGEYYYNINAKTLYKLQNGAGVAQTIDSETKYFYRGTLLKWTDEDGFSPDAKIININGIGYNYNLDVEKYIYEGSKIVWTNPLPSPFVNTATVHFTPSKDAVYTYNGYPFVFDGNRLVLNRVDNIIIENEDTLTDLSSIASSFDWSDSAIATRMNQLYALFDSLVQQYPNYVSKENAYSVANLEKPSYASDYETYVYHFKLSGSASTYPKPTVLLVSGTHGNEIWSGLNLYCFMKQICEGATANYYNMRATFNFEVVPCLNGYGIINATRTNANGVDINRNFDDNWESGKVTGSEAFSEAESKLVRNLTTLYNPLCAFDLHSYWGIDGAAFYSVLNNYSINKVIARRCIKDISRTLIKHLPSRFGSVDGHYYNVAMFRFAYEAGTDAHGTMAGWWAHTLRMCGTIEVDNDISYNNGEIVSNGVEWRNGNALSAAEYVLRIQLFQYCASAINYMANTYF